MSNLENGTVSRSVPIQSQIREMIPSNWELISISLDLAYKRGTLLCANRPLHDYHELFQNIEQSTGIGISFHASCTRTVQDEELIRKVQDALPLGCRILSFVHKPHPDFFNLEISGRKLSQDELREVREVIGRPIKVKAPDTAYSPTFGGKSRGALTLRLDIRETRQSTVPTDRFQITPFGACEDIGHSCFIVDSFGARILLDCGSSVRGKQPPPLDLEKIRDINLVVLSHTHLDHSGMIPWLYEAGRCRAPLVLSRPTLRLLPLLLHDSYRISRTDGSKPPYSLGAIAKSLQYAHYLDFNEEMPINADTSIQLLPAGHTLGAAQVLIKCKEQKLLYTGDISAYGTQSLRDACEPPAADIVLTEATYGNREHVDRATLQQKLLKAVEACCQNGGTVIIPSFAIGRGQEILSILSESSLLGRSAQFPVYADGGMLQRANSIYLRNIEDYGDRHHPFAERLRRALDPSLGFLRLVESHKRHDILYDSSPKVIVTTSGMGHGAAQTYIRRFGLDHKNLIIFVGYQSPNSVGHQLVHGERTLSLERDVIDVTAQVLKIGFSGHADSNQILNYLNAANPRTVVPVHGDTTAVNALGRAIELIMPQTNVLYPKVGETLDFTLPTL